MGWKEEEWEEEGARFSRGASKSGGTIEKGTNLIDRWSHAHLCWADLKWSPSMIRSSSWSPVGVCQNESVLARVWNWDFSSPRASKLEFKSETNSHSNFQSELGIHRPPLSYQSCPRLLRAARWQHCCYNNNNKLIKWEKKCNLLSSVKISCNLSYPVCCRTELDSALGIGVSVWSWILNFSLEFGFEFKFESRFGIKISTSFSLFESSFSFRSKWELLREKERIRLEFKIRVACFAANFYIYSLKWALEWTAQLKFISVCLPALLQAMSDQLVAAASTSASASAREFAFLSTFTQLHGSPAAKHEMPTC